MAGIHDAGVAWLTSAAVPGDPARITDEGVARLRARIGIPEPHPAPPQYTLPTVDTFRNVAIAYGDDNPLWCDPAYGPKTRWEQPIASPVLVGGDTLIGEDEVTAVAPEHADLMKGDPLRGVHAFYSADSLRSGPHHFRRLISSTLIVSRFL